MLKSFEQALELRLTRTFLSLELVELYGKMTSTGRHIRSLGQVYGHGISISWISTVNQIADIFTKGVGALKFIPLRDKLMGWKQAVKHEIDGVRKGELKSATRADPPEMSEGHSVT